MTNSCEIRPKTENKSGDKVIPILWRGLYYLHKNVKPEEGKTRTRTAEDAATRLFSLTIGDKNKKIFDREGVIRDEYDNVSLLSFINFYKPYKNSMDKSIDMKRALAYAYGFTTDTDDAQDDIDKLSDVSVVVGVDSKRGEELLEHVQSFNNTPDINELYVAKVIRKPDNKFYVVIENNTTDRNGNGESVRQSFTNRFVMFMRNKLKSVKIYPNQFNDLVYYYNTLTGDETNTALGLANEISGFIKLINGKKVNKVTPLMAIMLPYMFKTSGGYVSTFEYFKKDIQNKGQAGVILGDDYDAIRELFSENENGFDDVVTAYAILRHLNGEKMDGVNMNHLNNFKNAFSIKNMYHGEISEKDVTDTLKSADEGVGILLADYSDIQDTVPYIEGLSKEDESKFRNNLSASAANKEMLRKLQEAQRRMTNLMQDRLHDLNEKIESKDMKMRLVVERRLAKAREDNSRMKDMEAIQSYIDNFNYDLQKCIRIVNSLKEQSTAVSLKDRATKLKIVRDLCRANDEIINGLLLSENTRWTNTGYDLFDKNTLMQIQNISSSVKELEKEVAPIGKKFFFEMMEGFYKKDDAILIYEGKDKGKIITFEEYLTRMQDDISVLDRWLDSMSDSKNLLLASIGDITKKKKTLARSITLQDEQELLQLGMRLKRETGSSDQSFMFNRNEDGTVNPSTYITDYDNEAYQAAYRQKLKELDVEYGPKNERDSQTWKEYHDDLQRWIDSNQTKVFGDTELSMSRPDPAKFPNPAFAELSKAQKDFYYGVIKMKDKKDRLLTSGVTYLNNAVKVRKDNLERLKSSGSLSEAYDQAKKMAGDMFLQRSDDTEFGENEKGVRMVDFEGNKINHVPIFYVKDNPNDNPSDMSLDVVSSMILYCDMANNYDKLSEISSTLEVMQGLIHDGVIATMHKESGKALIESLRSQQERFENVLRNDPTDSRLLAKYHDFMEMQIWGRMKKQETIPGTKISANKAASFVDKFVALSTTAVNKLSMFANVSMGLVNFDIEALGGEYFTKKNAIIGQKLFWTHAPELVGQLGSVVKTNMLDLFNDYFEITQEFERDIKDVNFDNSNRLLRLGKRMFFGGNAMGEYYLKMLTALSYCDNINNRLFTEPPKNHTNNDREQVNIKKTVSVFDAYERVYLDQNHPEEGARLQMKRNLYMSDGRRIVTKEELVEMAAEMSKSGKKIRPENIVFNAESMLVSEYDFKNEMQKRIAKLNQDMHGIYNEDDKNMLQQYALGNLAIMYRKWIRPNLNRRFGKGCYGLDFAGGIVGQPSSDKVVFREGYYRTASNFMKLLYNNVKETKRLMISDEWHKLSPKQQSNVKKSIFEMAMFVLVATSAAILEGMKHPSDGDDGDEDDFVNSKTFAYIEYYTVRLKAEMGALTPISLLSRSGMITEFKQVLNNPITGVSVLERVTNVLDVIRPYGWSHIMESGPYKGHSKAYKSIMEAIPMWRTMRGNFNPEERARYYENLR